MKKNECRFLLELMSRTVAYQYYNDIGSKVNNMSRRFDLRINVPTGTHSDNAWSFQVDLFRNSIYVSDFQVYQAMAFRFGYETYPQVNVVLKEFFNKLFEREFEYIGLFNR
jgi:hypothetical protein